MSLPSSPAAATAAWVVRTRPVASPRVRLFCVPHAGAGASVFHQWGRGLGPGVEVGSIQLPGRETRRRERPLTRLAPVVEAITEAIGPWIHEPYALFGHSMGALVCFELARRLENVGRPPVRLVVSGRRAPARRSSERLLHRLPDDELVTEICLRYDGIPRLILDEPELVELFLPTLRADFELFETYAYEPEPRLRCPVSAFGGREDRQVTADELDDWAVVSEGPFERRIFDGGHFYLQTDPAPLWSALLEALGLD